MYLFRSQYLYPVYRDCSTTFDLCPLLCCFNVQSVTLSCSFWTSACFPAASTSNPTRFLYSFWTSAMLPRSFNVQSVTLSCSFWTSAMPPAASTSNPSRFLAPFGLPHASPQLQRPIHAFLLLLDFCHASRSFNVQSTTVSCSFWTSTMLPHSFNVQSTTISCSFWTSAMLPAALTSNPPRFLAPFGLPHASRSFNVQSTTLSCSFWTSAMPPAALTSNPPRFLAPFGLPHASRNFNVQSTTVSCSFWTSTMLPAASTSNPPRFLAHFGLLPASPQLQRPIHHAFLLILDFCLLPRHLKVQSTTHPSHVCLPTSYPQRKKATPAHPCQHCLISFNSIIQSNYNSIILKFSLKNQ